MDHSDVLARAWEIQKEREAAYGSKWKQAGAASNLSNAIRKLQRLEGLWITEPDGALALRKDALDDAYDAINYIAFFVRNATDGNIAGTPTQARHDCEGNHRWGYWLTDDTAEVLARQCTDCDLYQDAAAIKRKGDRDSLRVVQ